MTANEAIKILEVAKAECEWNAPLDYQEAFDMAISALREQLTCNKLQQVATDTISRQAVIDLYKQYQPYMAVKVVEFGKALEQLPSAQREIVRCKDCKYRTSYWGNCKLLEEKYHQSVSVDGDGFCSMAERKTNGVDC